MLVYSARRTVADCPCGRKYRFSEQQTHRATCLPYQREARRRAEREAISQKLRRSRRHTAELRANSRSVRLGGAQVAVELVSESLIPHLVALALFALLVQPLRRDGTFAAAVYNIAAAYSQQGPRLHFGAVLLAASLTADGPWLTS